MIKSKHAIWAIVAVFALVVISVMFVFLYIYRYFPFSCATGDYAFLNTSFEMSVPEAKRALRKHGAILTDFQTFKNMEAEVLIFSPSLLIPVYSEDRPSSVNFTLYMPSIEIFNAVTQGEFDFRNKRLNSVGIHFQSVALSKTSLLVDNLKQHLQKRYKYIGREDSNEVPGAYTLIYGNGKVNAKLWVNLTDVKKPIVSIWLLHLPTQAQDASRIKSREEDAF